MSLLTGGPARAAALGVILYTAACALPNVGLLDRGRVGDTPQYQRHGEAVLEGRVPYRDFYVEYPPGALAVFVPPAVGDDGAYATRFKALACALGAACAALVAASLAAVGASTRRLVAACALVGVAPALLGPVAIVNFDVWPAALTAAGIAALVAGRSRLALGALAVAAATKVYAVALVPLALLYVRARAGTRVALAAAAVFAAVAAAVVVPFFVLAPGGVGFSASVLARRGLQIESLGASLLLAAHRLGAYDPSVNSAANSQNLGGGLPSALAAGATVVSALAVAAVWILFARAPATGERLLASSAAAVAGLVAFGKVLSPQFLVWLLPLVPLAGGRRGLAASALLALALGLTQIWFPSRYGDLVALGGVSWVVLARDLVLVALFAVLVAAVRPRRTAESA